MAVRELNIVVKLDIDSIDFENEVSQELEILRSQIVEFSDSIDFFSESGAEAMKKFGESIGDSLIGKAESALARLAKNLGTTESSLVDLISKTKGNLRLEKEFSETAKAAGLTDDEIKKINRDLETTNRVSAFLAASMKKVASAGIDFAVSFVSSSVETGLALEKQNGILQNLSGSEYPKLKSAIDSAIESSKGLANQKQLTEVANDAIKAGISIDFISKNLSGLQQVAAVTGSELSSSMNDAYNSIQTGSDDFLKNNGALFASYSKEFEQINRSGMSEAAKRIAREKLISAALNENKTLQAAYGNDVQASSAILARFNSIVMGLKANFGMLILDALKPFLNLFIQIFEYFTLGEHALGRLKAALVIFGSILAGVLGGIAVKMILLSGITWGSMIPALFAMAAAGWAAIAPWIPFIAIGALVGATIAAIVLVVQDLVTWMDGGDSVIGRFLGPFKDFDIKKLFGQAFQYLVNLAKQYGKYLIMALFPISILYFYFDEIVTFFKSLPGLITNLFAGIGQEIQKLLSGVIPPGLLSAFNTLTGNTNQTTQVNDAIITKDGKVVKFHPDDNILAAKDLSSIGKSKSASGGGIVVNIAEVVLGSASSKEDAQLFASYLEKELEKIAVKIGLGSGISPEAI